MIEEGIIQPLREREHINQIRQVADRFHLAQNLTTRIEEILAKHRAEICQVAKPPESLSDLPDEQESPVGDRRPALEPHAQLVVMAHHEERQDRDRQLPRTAQPRVANDKISSHVKRWC